jgi:hypothetical protein
MIMDQGEEVLIPSIDEFSPKYLDELKEDIILDRRMRTSRKGDVDYLRVGSNKNGKNLEYSKLSEIGIIAKIMSQAF